MGQKTVKFCDGCKREFEDADGIHSLISGDRVNSRVFHISTIVLASEYYTESGPYGERTRDKISLEFCRFCATSLKVTLEKLLGAELLQTQEVGK
jgi:hypothetical protein